MLYIGGWPDEWVRFHGWGLLCMVNTSSSIHYVLPWQTQLALAADTWPWRQSAHRTPSSATWWRTEASAFPPGFQPRRPSCRRWSETTERPCWPAVPDSRWACSHWVCTGSPAHMGERRKRTNQCSKLEFNRAVIRGRALHTVLSRGSLVIVRHGKSRWLPTRNQMPNWLRSRWSCWSSSLLSNSILSREWWEEERPIWRRLFSSNSRCSACISASFRRLHDMEGRRGIQGD